MLGTALSKVIPIQSIQIVAGAAFLAFALWSLRDENETDSDENKSFKLNPVLTVAAAFFIGELGDKTQLTAITLSTTAHYPAFILAGTVTGMIATGGIGIFIGKKIGDRVPDFAIKIASSVIFLLFGTIKLYQSVPSEWLTPLSISLFALVIGIPYVLLLGVHAKRIKRGEPSLYVKRSQVLYDYYHTMTDKLDHLCNNCSVCLGTDCMLGYSRILVKKGLMDPSCPLSEVNPHNLTLRTHDPERLREALSLTDDLLSNSELAEHPARQNVVQIQTTLVELLNATESKKS